MTAIPQTSFITLSVFDETVSLNDKKREAVISLLTNSSYNKISTIKIKERMNARINELKSAYTAMGTIASEIVDNNREPGQRGPYEVISDPEIVREKMDQPLSEELARSIQDSTDDLAKFDVDTLASLQTRRASHLRRFKNKLDLVIETQYDWREFQIPPSVDRLFDGLSDNQLNCHTCKAIFVWISNTGTSSVVMNSRSHFAALLDECKGLFDDNLPSGCALNIIMTSDLKTT